MKLQETKQLTEAFKLQQIDFSKFDTSNFVECFFNDGLRIHPSEFEYTEGNNAFKYLGYKVADKEHVFSVMMEDENAGPHKFLVTKIFIWLGKEGKLHGEFQSMPDLDDVNEPTAFKYLKSEKEYWK